MAVAWFRNPVLDEHYPLIDGHTVEDMTFGVTSARRHPAYVHSVNRNASLMHKVASVTIHWYALVGDGGQMGRLKQPAMLAKSVCGMSFCLKPDRARTCTVPAPGAVLCGRCHGERPTYAGHAKVTRDGVSKVEAKVRLGCEVAGYPSRVRAAREAS